MDELAASANVSKVTIYKYFGDKDELFLHVGKTLLDEYSNQLEEKSSEDTIIETRIKNIIEIISNFIASDKLSLFMDLNNLNYNLEDEYTHFNNKYQNILIKLINQGKQSNIINKAIDSKYIFHYIDMGISYFQHNTAYRNKMLNDEIFQKEYMDFLLSNIFIKESD